jgi:uncharacterized membrane protein
VKFIRSYLITGLVVWLPILATFLVVKFIVNLLNQSIALLPMAYQPQQLFGVNIPGFGVLISLMLLLLTGIIATNFLGQHFMKFGESLLDRIPLVRTVYNSTKQVINAILASNSKAFRKVVLVEYPRKGIWSIAFQTSDSGFVENPQVDDSMITVFIPTTPNPTSGFLMMVMKSEVQEISMTPDEALKCVISLGIMTRKNNNSQRIPSAAKDL